MSNSQNITPTFITATVAYILPSLAMPFLREISRGRPIYLACSLKQTDLQIDGPRPTIVFFRQDLLGFEVVEGEFKGHMLSLSLLSLLSAPSGSLIEGRMRFQYNLDPQSQHWRGKHCPPSRSISFSFLKMARMKEGTFAITNALCHPPEDEPIKSRR